MSVRKIGIVVVFLTLAYGAWPLIAASEMAAEICCSDSGDCPDGLKCWSDGTPCSPGRDGHCVPPNGT
jgi:hypothetical protein